MKVKQSVIISPFVEHVFLYLFVTSAEVPNTKLLCIVGFILICSMDHFGNIHIYIGHEMKWIQFKI